MKRIHGTFLPLLSAKTKPGQHSLRPEMSTHVLLESTDTIPSSKPGALSVGDFHDVSMMTLAMTLAVNHVSQTLLLATHSENDKPW